MNEFWPKNSKIGDEVSDSDNEESESIDSDDIYTDPEMDYEYEQFQHYVSGRDIQPFGIQPYAFEPVWAPGEQEANEKAERLREAVSDNTKNLEADRSEKRLGLDSEWCQCGGCNSSSLSYHQECVCCEDVAETRSFREACPGPDGIQCITNCADFQSVCLNQSVLKNLLVCYNDVRQTRWDLNDNRSYRWAALSQFMWLVYRSNQILRPVPACVTHQIRLKYPSTTGQYTYSYCRH